MTGREDAGKRQRAFQLDLLKADLNIGFALIRSALAGYETGQRGIADRNLECARDAYADAARLLRTLAGPETRVLEFDVSKLRSDIESIERFRNHAWLQVRAVYN